MLISCALVATAVAMAAGCFAPVERDGAIACGEDDACPPGFQCHAPDGRCYRETPGGVVDAAVTAPDAATPDAQTIDGGEVDASLVDSGGADAFDAAGDFCARYEAVCGFAAGPDRYDDIDHCLAEFASYDEPRASCVQTALELAEAATAPGVINNRCTEAAGNPPCS